MPGLKENTTYSDANQAMSSMINKLSTIGKSIPRNRKTANTAKYSNLANNVQSNLGTITTPYGGSTRYEQYHPGVDIANKIGTPIPTYSGGTVVEERTGSVQGSPDFGNYIIVQDEQGNKFRYSHLNRIYVKVGEKIAKGQVLGEIGNTGQTYSESGGTGAHLDLRIQDIYGKYINPNQYING